MRSIPLLAVSTVILGAAWACGGGSNVGPNNPPVANFTVASCTAGAPCQFTDASTDDNAVTGWEWNFGDANATAADNTSTLQSPVHTYSQPGDYTVSLKASDASGENNTKTQTVTVAAAGPTAAFTVSCNGLDCSFTNGSTGSGTLTYNWDFGDGSAHATDINPVHSYNVTVVTPFTVTLIVTDVQSRTGTTSQAITVTPPANQQCGVGGTTGTCTLGITARATVKITLTTVSCELTGNRLSIDQPVSARQTVFFNACTKPVGSEYTVKDNTGAALVFDALTQIQFQFTQGAGKPTDPPRGTPGLRMTGTFPDWTISIDDGGNAGQPGEPDFNDLILAVHATRVP